MVEIRLTDKDYKMLHSVLDYLLDMERRHYEEHIFTEHDDELKDFELPGEGTIGKFLEHPKMEHIYEMAYTVKRAVEGKEN